MKLGILEFGNVALEWFGRRIIYFSARPHQMAPIAMASREEPKLNFCGRSGRLKISPARRVPSPMKEVARTIMATVPAAYADKKARFPPQLATANAGAREGAPSHENPCSSPLK